MASTPPPSCVRGGGIGEHPCPLSRAGGAQRLGVSEIIPARGHLPRRSRQPVDRRDEGPRTSSPIPTRLIETDRREDGGMVPAFSRKAYCGYSPRFRRDASLTDSGPDQATHLRGSHDAIWRRAPLLPFPEPTLFIYFRIRLDDQREALLVWRMGSPEREFARLGPRRL